MISVYVKKCGDDMRSQRDTAYELLFGAVKEQFGITASKADIYVGERGKPYFEGIPVSFNISHCKGTAVCAVCERGCGEVGVDCENMREYRPSVAKRVFTPAEIKLVTESGDMDLCFTRLWTAKESYVKYTGTGIAGNMKKIEFSFSGENIMASDNGVDIRSARTDEGCIITLCCRKGENAVFFDGDLCRS